MQLRAGNLIYVASLQAALVLTGSFAATAAPGLGLAPHRAIYDMELGEAEERSGIASLSGLMVYDFSGSACDGYSISFRFVTRFQSVEGGSQVTDLRTSSHESGDGDSYQFLSKTYVDQKLVEATRGTAKDLDGAKSVDLKEPEERAFEIDQSTLFPTVHLRTIIEAAKDGESFLVSEVYDGSETGDKIYQTTTVIGEPRLERIPVKGSSDASAVEVPQVTHWPVTIAYFDPSVTDGGEQLPVYQLSFLLYENGISRRMSLDYGDFVIKGSLRDLELYEEASCTN
ncbi:cell envelope integrity EipB family protein [Roseibium sp.]|uniref:cell envelope integrity EipB family protein n=1 Tax=Roseibium sp. TaxID=1936156 RepID=UPI003263813D